MSRGYLVAYPVAPTLALRNPLCSACSTTVDCDGEDFICPTCGTMWPANADDDTVGMLYKDWSGEDSGAPLAELDDGWKTVMLAESAKRRAQHQRPPGQPHIFAAHTPSTPN